MATTLNFKDIIDLPTWRPLANGINNANVGVGLAFDLRNNEDRHPLIYQLVANANFNSYSVKNDEWMTLATPALAGTFGAGASCIFAPSQGPNGTLTTGSTTTSVVLSTALPAAVGLNQLANRGAGTQGFKIRIIGNSSGGSGKTEERYIVNNTSGTTPTIYVDSAFSFTPASGDRYEILSGRVFLLGALTLAAGQWKYYDVATNSYSGSLATSNLPASIVTDSTLVSLDELHVPCNLNPGDGFFGTLTATASGGTTLTGPASGGDTVVSANEYRNFQIRIVTDTGTPTAVGQRRRITSHTSGTSAIVYTVPTWTVTPSTTAVYVIENDSDKILLWSSGVTTTFTYNISGNTWDTTTFAARGSAVAGGCWAEQGFGLNLSTNRLSQHSYIYSGRGGNVNSIDLLDISGGANGVWSNAITYGNQGLTTFATGTAAAYDPATNSGRYVYINQNGTQRNYRFDMQRRVLEPFAFLRFPQGTVAVGAKIASTLFVDGTTKLSFMILCRQAAAEMFQVAVST